MKAELNRQPKDVMVCLDLEGTLISNAVSQIPRPHLSEFLHGLSEFADIVLFTSVSEERTKAIKTLLTEEKCVPEWFKNLRSLHPKGTVKKKALVPNKQDYETLLLVDDQSTVVDAGEDDWFVQINEFLPPYSQDDRELLSTLAHIKQRSHLPKTFKAAFRPSASRLKSIAEKGYQQMEDLAQEDVGKWSE
jgi:hypothetical protein